MSRQKPKSDETKTDAEPLWDSDEENKTKNNSEKEDVVKDNKNVLQDLSHYKPAFRELDMEVKRELDEVTTSCLLSSSY